MKTIHDVDFAQLYKNHKQLAARPRSEAKKWDDKAQNIVVGQLQSPYTQALLAALDLRADDSLLDVGCGAGAVAVLVAPLVKQVYALDYSQGMLDKMRANAEHYNTHNIIELCKDWDESWSEVPVCDVVVASRSTLVEDMEAALLKLHAQARRHVYLTYPATNTFAANPEVDATQEPQRATPSYLYILAILHQHGIQAQLRFIDAGSRWALIDWAV
ncbi:MAG TPA: class I SAM-dependent methyltransferase [Alcaligenaceae bacterium]|nr:class I SAM-dependent methyltransferase [Alcaligenaceae bacterium]